MAASLDFLPNTDRKQFLRAEQVRLLYAAMPLAILASMINATALATVEWGVADRSLLISWIVGIALVTLACGALTLAYRMISPERTQAGRWGKYCTLGLITAGAAWGSSAFFLFPEDSIAHQVIVAFIVAGVCAGAAITLSPLNLPICSFVFLALLPLIVRFFMLNTQITDALAGILALFLIIVSASARKNYRNTRRFIEGSANEHQGRAILEAKLELQAVLDYAPVGIWLVGVDGRYRFVNKTFCDAIGIPESAFLATTDVTELMGEEAGGNCQASDQACLAQDKPHLSYETLKFVDGKLHLLEITKAKVRDETGTVIGVVGIGMDITEQRAAKEKLRKLSQAVEQAGESIVITDKDGTIEYVNPSFTTITGYAAEEVLGKKPNVLKSGEQSGEYYSRLWNAIRNGEVWQSTIVDRRKDGSRFPAMLSISPINDSAGQITHYVGIQQDMTEHEMLESKFRQAQKMEALGTLVGGIAHDFNNMLTGMAGNLFLAKERVADMPDIVERLDAAEELSYRASAMIKQLLIFARKGSVEKKSFGLISFLKETCKLHQVSIPKSIRFQTQFCRDELIINGDTTQLQQVLLNLFNNARDAVAGMPDPVISLAVEPFQANDSFMTAHSLTGQRSFAHIIVNDNGCGISDANREHIFEPFFTTKEIGVGTGLGLAMSYGSIQAHGGILEVESTLGKGSAFHLYLPLIGERQRNHEADNLTETVLGNGELILIADDNADVRSAGKDVLEKLGYRVVEATDGLEAINVYIAHRNDIALVILDIIMPKLSGPQTAERIRTLYPDVKVIFSTGYDKEKLLQAETPSDEAVVLYKPYNVQVLSQMIRRQLDS